jgi:hypothetical protein
LMKMLIESESVSKKARAPKMKEREIGGTRQ